MATSSRIDYSTLFEMSDPLADAPLRLALDGRSKSLSAGQRASLYKGGWEGIDLPMMLRAFMGGRATDFLWGWGPCISSKVLTLLETEGLSGWSIYPVEIRDRKGVLLPEYHGLAVTGRAIKWDKSRSEVVTVPSPVPSGRPHGVYRGMYFDESEWDGSDMFWVGVRRVVTQRVKKALDRAKVRNVRFTPLTEVEVDTYLDRFAE